MPERQEQWAVFWCSLLSPLLYGEIPPEEAGRFLEQLASCEQVFPDGQRRRPSRATLWRKWKKYRDGGFEEVEESLRAAASSCLSCALSSRSPAFSARNRAFSCSSLSMRRRAAVNCAFSSAISASCRAIRLAGCFVFAALLASRTFMVEAILLPHAPGKVNC